MTAEKPGRLRVLHLVLHLRATNSQYNEHALPVMDQRSISMCTFFPPQIETPEAMRIYPGNGSVRGFLAVLRSALRAENPDVVHAHSPYTGFLLVLAIVLGSGIGTLRWRTVYTVHDSFYDFRLRHKVLMIPVFAAVARVVFCSEAACDSVPWLVRRLIGSRASVVQNGVDVARIDGVARRREDPAPRPFTVVSIGRLEPVKDPLLMLEAFARGVGTDGCLIVIGDGALRSELEAAVSEAGLDRHVTLTGMIDRHEVFRHLGCADVFLSTSHGEGLPVAVMEAMAVGVPVVLSDIAPHRELDIDPAMVRLVRPGDAEGFARELRRLRTQTPAERQVTGAALRELVATRFSLERMTAGYESVYRQLVAESRS